MDRPYDGPMGIFEGYGEDENTKATIETLVDEELKLLKPQLSRTEWFQLERALRVSLTRLAVKASKL